MQPIRFRMCLTKGEEIRFVSHLEYAKALERALRRAKVPAAYSEGFNPHMKLSLASALAVGTTSRGECAEVELTETRILEDLMSALSVSLPPGMKLIKGLVVEGPAPKLMAIVAGAAYQIRVPFHGDLAILEQLATTFLALSSFAYEKKSLKGKAAKTLDLRALIRDIAVSSDKSGVAVIDMKMAMPPDGTIKPLEALKVLQQQLQWPLELERALVERLSLYENQSNEWRPVLGG